MRPTRREALTREKATDVDFLQQALLPMASATHSAEDVAAQAKCPRAHLVFDLCPVMTRAVSGGAGAAMQ